MAAWAGQQAAGILLSLPPWWLFYSHMPLPPAHLEGFWEWNSGPSTESISLLSKTSLQFQRLYTQTEMQFNAVHISNLGDHFPL